MAEPDSVVAQQEFFGPVQCLIGYDDEEDAIRIANNSNYGLSGGILCADIERAKRVARRIRTGTMMINGGMWYGPDVPFGAAEEKVEDKQAIAAADGDKTEEEKAANDQEVVKAKDELGEARRERQSKEGSGTSGRRICLDRSAASGLRPER